MLSLLIIGGLLIAPIEVSAISSEKMIDPYIDIPYVDGETSLGVQVVESVPSDTLSFEVPLYVTMAVEDLNEQVILPDNYGITNLSTNHLGQGVDMAVIWVEATPRSTNDYWKFVEETPELENEMQFNIGGIPVVVDGGESTFV